MKSPSIVYIVGTFPLLSETFIINEICELLKRELPIRIFCTGPRRALPANMHAAGKALSIQTTYMPYDAPTLLLTVLRFMLGHPAQTLRLWRASRQTPVLPGQRKLKNWARALVIADFAHQQHAAHLHGHWTTAADLAKMVAQATGRTFSFTVHAHDLYEEDPRLAAQGGGIAARSQGASFIATCTDYNRQHMVAQYGDRIAAPLHTVYHGINADFFRPGARDNQPPVILSVGRIIAYKGFDRLVEILRRAHEDGLDFTCYLVGEGSLLAPLRERVKELGLADQIILTGGLPAREVRAYYQRADIFVLAGSLRKGQHGLPNVLVEGMSAGLAVLTTSLPPATELIDPGVNGLIVADDDEALYAALRELLGDAARRQRLGTAARQTVVQHFSLAASTQQLYELFQQAAGDRLGLPSAAAQAADR